MTQLREQVYHQLGQFRESLPDTCACTNSLGVTLYRTSTVAATMRYLNPNHPNSIKHLVYDLDRPLAALAWEDRNCPAPTWAAINPENGHAHLGYSLASPIHLNPDSSRKAMRYGAAVEASLRAKLGGDPGYAGNLTKNPLHPYWPTYCFSDLAYELDTLAAHLDLAFDGRRRVQAEGVGRNVTLFDRIRFHAYAARRNAAQGWLSEELFIHHLLGVGMGFNEEFAVPLYPREVAGIAKSVGRWTWENFSPEGFRLWCDNRRAKSLRLRAAQSQERAQRIRELAQTFPDLTQPQIAKLVGVSPRTVWKALQNAQNGA